MKRNRFLLILFLCIITAVLWIICIFIYNINMINLKIVLYVSTVSINQTIFSLTLPTHTDIITRRAWSENNMLFDSILERILHFELHVILPQNGKFDFKNNQNTKPLPTCADYSKQIICNVSFLKKEI